MHKVGFKIVDHSLVIEFSRCATERRAHTHRYTCASYTHKGHCHADGLLPDFATTNAQADCHYRPASCMQITVMCPCIARVMDCISY